MRSSFASRFADAWAAPTPQRLADLLHPDVVLYQPHLPPIRGRDSAMREFERLFAFLPGLHGEVDLACESGDVVFIEWRMKFPVGGRAAEIRAVDRLFLRDGLVIERAVYFDQVAMMRAVVAHPAMWRRYARYRLG